LLLYRTSSWCTKTFSFTVGEIIDGIQGILDFIFAPFNALVDTIINAIPIPELPIPKLPNLDLIQLNLPILPDLPDLNVPAPFDQLVPVDLTGLFNAVKFGSVDFDSVINVIRPAFPEFQPICDSTD
jgi:hypothetical protein